MGVACVDIGQTSIVTQLGNFFPIKSALLIIG